MKKRSLYTRASVLGSYQRVCTTLIDYELSHTDRTTNVREKHWDTDLIEVFEAESRRCRTLFLVESVRSSPLGRSAFLLGWRNSFILPNQGCLLGSGPKPESALEHGLPSPSPRFCKGVHVKHTFQGHTEGQQRK